MTNFLVLLLLVLFTCLLRNVSFMTLYPQHMMWTWRLLLWPRPAPVGLVGMVGLTVALVPLPVSAPESDVMWASYPTVVTISWVVSVRRLSSTLGWVIGVLAVLIGFCSDDIGSVSLFLCPPQPYGLMLWSSWLGQIGSSGVSVVLILSYLFCFWFLCVGSAMSPISLLPQLV